MSHSFRRIVGLLGWLAGVGIVYVAASIDFEVAMRYFLHSPTRWVTDFSEYALVFISFFGGAWVLAKERHVKIEILLNVLPPGVQRRLNIITSVAGAITFGLLFWYSLVLTWNAFETNKMFIKATVVPAWLLYIPMVLGSLMVMLQFIRRAWLYASGRKVPEGNDS